MTSLACQSLDVSIGGKDICSKLNLALEPGQFWGLLGPNGIGKTTLLKCMAGLSPPDSGNVLLENQGIENLPRRVVARLLGMLQQHTVYVFDASVLETAMTGRHPHLAYWEREGPKDKQKALDAIRAVDLAGFESRSVTGLSGGEARRLAFASLIVQEPAILLLDEPTNHLDMKHQIRIMNQVKGQVIDENRSAMIALHDVNLAARYCTHIVMLLGKGDWQAGPVLELLDRENLERLYQCPVEVVQTSSGRRFLPGS
ncbi:MAG: ABC transporter ATP-binding protein [Xanthomonadales bacterium]|nr:ABC transporter ATP-binding protein [Xanthomonadales bacterium]MDH4021048.1 ABC transporter ATP-binding protein [Xanthomonadales bacterium]